MVGSRLADTEAATAIQRERLVGGGAGGSWTSRTSAHELNPWFEPSASHFIVRDLAVGASLRLDRDQLTTDAIRRTDTATSLDLHAMYHVALGGTLSTLPRLALGIAYVDRDHAFVPGSQLPGGTGLNYRVWSSSPFRDAFRSGDHVQLESELFIPLVVTPARGFSCGVGPYVHWSYAIGRSFFEPVADHWLLELGLSTVLGTWL